MKNCRTCGKKTDYAYCWPCKNEMMKKSKPCPVCKVGKINDEKYSKCWDCSMCVKCKKQPRVGRLEVCYKCKFEVLKSSEAFDMLQINNILNPTLPKHIMSLINDYIEVDPYYISLVKNEYNYIVFGVIKGKYGRHKTLSIGYCDGGLPWSDDDVIKLWIAKIMKYGDLKYNEEGDRITGIVAKDRKKETSEKLKELWYTPSHVFLRELSEIEDSFSYIDFGDADYIPIKDIPKMCQKFPMLIKKYEDNKPYNYIYRIKLPEKLTDIDEDDRNDITFDFIYDGLDFSYRCSLSPDLFIESEDRLSFDYLINDVPKIIDKMYNEEINGVYQYKIETEIKEKYKNLVNYEDMHLKEYRCSQAVIITAKSIKRIRDLYYLHHLVEKILK